MTYVNVQKIKQKNVELPAKISALIMRDKLGVDQIGPCKIRRKGRDYSIVKSVTMIDCVAG